MTIEQLQILQAIVTHKTFSQAAYALHLSQSVLSKQIAKLEKELEVEIFDRSHRQVCLTKQGEIVQARAKEILHAYQEMCHDLRNSDEHAQNILRVAMLPVLSQYQFSKRMDAFQIANPHLSIILKEIEERDLQNDTIIHEFDVFLLRDGSMLKVFQSNVLYRDELCCVMSKHHPLSKHKKIPLIALTQETLLVLPKDTSITKLAQHSCVQAGFQPHQLRHGRLETIMAQAHEGEGVALVMKDLLRMFQLDNVHVATFTPPITGDIQIFYTTSQPLKTSVQAFLTFLA